jgi:PilZ domain
MIGGGGRRISPRCVYERPIKFELNYVYGCQLITIEQDGMGIDISGRGLGMFTAYPLKDDETLRLHFPMNHVETTLPVFARVVWTRLVDNRFRVGFEFIT